MLLNLIYLFITTDSTASWCTERSGLHLTIEFLGVLSVCGISLSVGCCNQLLKYQPSYSQSYLKFEGARLMKSLSLNFVCGIYWYINKKLKVRASVKLCRIKVRAYFIFNATGRSKYWHSTDVNIEIQPPKMCCSIFTDYLRFDAISAD